ncbi:hypothetical protein K4G60_g1602 [Candida parapsilosis]|nr:hypothetical protein K4G60_g1602 [Candida parapsilosis]
MTLKLVSNKPEPQIKLIIYKRIYTSTNPNETNETKTVTNCIDLGEVNLQAEFSDEEETECVSSDDDDDEVVVSCSLESVSADVVATDEEKEEASVSTLLAPPSVVWVDSDVSVVSADEAELFGSDDDWDS